MESDSYAIRNTGNYIQNKLRKEIWTREEGKYHSYVV